MRLILLTDCSEVRLSFFLDFKDESTSELRLRDLRLIFDIMEFTLPLEEMEERGRFLLSCSFKINVVAFRFSFGLGLQQQEQVIITVRQCSSLLHLR